MHGTNDNAGRHSTVTTREARSSPPACVATTCTRAHRGDALPVANVSTHHGSLGRRGARSGCAGACTSSIAPVASQGAEKPANGVHSRSATQRERPLAPGHGRSSQSQSQCGERIPLDAKPTHSHNTPMCGAHRGYSPCTITLTRYHTHGGPWRVYQPLNTRPSTLCARQVVFVRRAHRIVMIG